MTVTIELLHKDIQELREEVRSLKECIHEDLLELNGETKKDIEMSRTALSSGKGIPLEEIKKKWGKINGRVEH